MLKTCVRVTNFETNIYFWMEFAQSECTLRNNNVISQKSTFRSNLREAPRSNYKIKFLVKCFTADSKKNRNTLTRDETAFWKSRGDTNRKLDDHVSGITSANFLDHTSFQLKHFKGQTARVNLNERTNEMELYNSIGREGEYVPWNVCVYFWVNLALAGILRPLLFLNVRTPQQTRHDWIPTRPIVYYVRADATVMKISFTLNYALARGQPSAALPSRAIGGAVWMQLGDVTMCTSRHRVWRN